MRGSRIKVAVVWPQVSRRDCVSYAATVRRCLEHWPDALTARARHRARPPQLRAPRPRRCPRPRRLPEDRPGGQYGRPVVPTRGAVRSRRTRRGGRRRARRRTEQAVHDAAERSCSLDGVFFSAVRPPWPKMMMAAADTRAPQAACSMIIHSGKGRKASTAPMAIRMTAAAMRRRSSARSLPLAARLAKTKVRTEVAATMMPRTHAAGSPGPGRYLTG